MISLLIKLVGVYAMVQLVPGVVQAWGVIVASFTQFKDQSVIMLSIVGLSMLITPMLWIGLCLWVIRKSDGFAERLYPVDAPAGQLTTLGFKEIQLLGFHFIGLTLVVRALPSLIHTIHQWILFSRYDVENRYPASYRYQWIMLAIQLAIGLYLFLYPQNLAKLLAKIKGKHCMKADSYDI